MSTAAPARPVPGTPCPECAAPLTAAGCPACLGELTEFPPTAWVNVSNANPFLRLGHLLAEVYRAYLARDVGRSHPAWVPPIDTGRRLVLEGRLAGAMVDAEDLVAPADRGHLNAIHTLAADLLDAAEAGTAHDYGEHEIPVMIGALADLAAETELLWQVWHEDRGAARRAAASRPSNMAGLPCPRCWAARPAGRVPRLTPVGCPLCGYSLGAYSPAADPLPLMDDPPAYELFAAAFGPAGGHDAADDDDAQRKQVGRPPDVTKARVVDRLRELRGQSPPTPWRSMPDVIFSEFHVRYAEATLRDYLKKARRKDGGRKG